MTNPYDEFTDADFPRLMIERMMAGVGELCASAILPVTTMENDGVHRKAMMYMSTHKNVDEEDPDVHTHVCALLTVDDLDLFIARMTGVRELLMVPEMIDASPEDVAAFLRDKGVEL